MKKWSLSRDSNPGPLPYQGSALPCYATEAYILEWCRGRAFRETHQASIRTRDLQISPARQQSYNLDPGAKPYEYHPIIPRMVTSLALNQAKLPRQH